MRTQPQSEVRRSRLRPLSPIPERKTKEAVAPKARKAEAPQVIVEIPDSDSIGDYLSPSPRSSPEPLFSSPPAVDVSVSVDEDTELSLTMSPTGQQTAAFVFITKAVTTAPRSQDPRSPSWYDKMLLSDPIVVEDLAAWLNLGQLDRVDYDGAGKTSQPP